MTAPSCPDKYADELSCVNADDVAVIVRAVRRQATARDDNAAAILVSLWSDRSTLLAKLLAAEAELSRAREERATLTRDAAIGAAIQRAAGELPDGWNIAIDVERGAGSVYLHGPDDSEAMDVDSDNRLAAEINVATDRALAAYSTARQTEKL